MNVNIFFSVDVKATQIILNEWKNANVSVDSVSLLFIFSINFDIIIIDITIPVLHILSALSSITTLSL